MKISRNFLKNKAFYKIIFRNRDIYFKKTRNMAKQ